MSDGGVTLALADGAGDPEGSQDKPCGKPVRFGVTAPITLQLPTPAELALSEQLQEEMRRDAPLDSPDGMHARAGALVELGASCCSGSTRWASQRS